MSDLTPVTVLVLVGTTELNHVISGKGATMNPVIAGFIVGIGLYGLEGVNPELARVFSILIIVGALLENGGPIFASIGGKLK